MDGMDDGTYQKNPGTKKMTKVPHVAPDKSNTTARFLQNTARMRVSATQITV